MTEGKGSKNSLEDMFMLRDKASPHMSGQIAVWFVAQEIDKSEKIPCISLYRSTAHTPILESEFFRDRNPSNGTV